MPTSYRDLKVWEKSMRLVEEVYRLARKLPSDERFSLSDQMRRAAVSIPSNIAEGHGRTSPNEFAQFLSVARGSLFELTTQLQICERIQLRRGYLKKCASVYDMYEVKNAPEFHDQFVKDAGFQNYFLKRCRVPVRIYY